MTKNERERRKNAMRNNAILNSYFRLFPWRRSFRYFVFSPGVISSFRFFRMAFFVISSFRLALFSPRHNAKRNDQNTKHASRKDEITKKRHAKRRNNEKTPSEKTTNNERTPGEKTK